MDNVHVFPLSAWSGVQYAHVVDVHCYLSQCCWYLSELKHGTLVNKMKNSQMQHEIRSRLNNAQRKTVIWSHSTALQCVALYERATMLIPSGIKLQLCFSYSDSIDCLKHFLHSCRFIFSYDWLANVKHEWSLSVYYVVLIMMQLSLNDLNKLALCVHWVALTCLRRVLACEAATRQNVPTCW